MVSMNASDVRYESITDIYRLGFYVCFTPNNGHNQQKNGHRQFHVRFRAFFVRFTPNNGHSR